MKRILSFAVLLLSMLPRGEAATIPLYINSAPYVAPLPNVPVTNIDARAWWNRALFDVTTTIPFEAQNNRFFTNTSPTNMIFHPGVRFQRNTNGQRFWMDSWVNRGKIVTDQDTLFSSLGFTFFINDTRASILQVAASNIVATGPLFSGTHGLVRLEGNKIDVSRNALRTGSSVGPTFRFGSSFFTGASNYVNDVGIRDLYWGGGRGDSVAAARSGLMNLTPNSFYPNFNAATPSSTIHEIIQPSSFSSFLFTNTTTVPGGVFFSGNSFFINTNLVGYTAIANLITNSATNRIVQMIFYPTNINDPDFSTEARFFSGFGSRGAAATVGFHAREFDIATRTTVTNSVYLVDGLATTTNFFFARNVATSTRRPNTYAVTRVAPTEFVLGSGGNTAYSNSLVYGNFTQTAVTNRYAAYAALVDLLSSSPSGSIPYNVTNVPGRVEIIGDEVNLDQTRIRAESAVIIKAKNLVSNNLAQVDAPFVNFDVRSVQPVFNVVNLAPATVRRFAGSVRAWSATWDNFEISTVGTNLGSNSVTFHVLVVESQLRSTLPVTVNEFAVRATNVVLGDQLNIAKSFVVEANSLHVTGGISLPPGASLTASNFLNVRNFTNDGIITVPGTALYGTDRALSYSNWVNHGTNTAASVEIRTRNFENSGALVANGGSFLVDTVNASLLGKPLVSSNFMVTNITFDFFTSFLVTNIFTNTVTLQSAPVINGASDVEIRARDVLMSNAVINAGTLILNVTNRLADSGTEATNFWNVFGGFQALRRPASSDLLGTHVRSSCPFFGLSDHSWAGVDMGVDASGFTNNLALGKLTFDGAQGSLFRFFPVGAANALYVDYIELLNDATNYNSAFSISPNFTIYFANANVPVTKLHGAAGGRFQWVSSFAGPLSSTNITYHTPPNAGSNFVFNIALVTDNDLDSDGDGLVNSQDDEPIYVPGSAMLSVAMASGPSPCVLLTWNALAYSSNYLEFKASTTATQWNTLTNFHMGPFTWPVMVDDPISTNGEMRVYRIRVDIGPYY